ncbi:MAG: DedA family protein [Gaiellaceae bacterium]|nr:DedA family protein [Gaiellaceae bacterium]
MPLAVLLASILSELSDAITSIVGDYGLYAVFWLMFVDAVLPAASELVMVYGGALAAGAFANQQVTLFGRTVDEGWPAYVAIVLAGTVGYTLGSMMGWAIGLYGGRPYLERHGRWLHLNEAKLEKAERWFERWEDWAVFLGRLTPVVRSFVSVPAGVFETPFVRYTLLTFLGSTIWCALFAGAGLAAGESWEDFHHAFRYVEYLVAVAIVGGAAWLGWRYFRRRRARLAQDSSGA